MKKATIIIVVFIIFGILLALAPIPHGNPTKSLFVSPSAALNTPTTAVALPSRISIPKLGVDTIIESVTVDNMGRMDVPKNFYNTAWYSLGAKPGESGSAVIDGHVDTPQGLPSVFAYIEKLVPGDKIIITSSDGKTYTFIVTDSHDYSLEAIPLEAIFDQTTDEKRLNLITCSGTWDTAKKIYSNRFVVYSKIENEGK